jgi:hypothetical protein
MAATPTSEQEARVALGAALLDEKEAWAALGAAWGREIERRRSA